ncbi:MAG: hypothetical protein L0H79_18040 [Intrasporangium sp.]|uniref:hypothetical protein n=1 Tax=Intrasporangium sp. TaxID=1925024 RepID=UPI002649A518|nr:hypothetical protein [Intrasporangium sp.]MDN5797629.1 hypothetical protein [Intrasporangium sp.]
MAAPFRVGRSTPAPTQQSSTTCGPACVTVARMLANPAFADWVRHGYPDDQAQHTADDRFAACEQVVVRRTNGLVGAGERLQPPWPRALGTPPWGARAELEHGVAVPGTRYETQWFRLAGRARLGNVHEELRSRTHEVGPALLYIGSTWLPRHIVLVLPGGGGPDPDLYEPSTGRVVGLPRDRFVARRLRLAGWDVPWCAVWPAASR